MAYRGIAGLRPLWRQPNLVPGRFHRPQPASGATAGAARTVQYLSLHPMGPMAELLRHQPVAIGDPPGVMRSVFAFRLRLDGILRVGFDSASELGIAPSDLVGDDHRPCQAWAASLLADEPAVQGLRVPSAALPGTENLVVFGPRTPIGYLARPRRATYLPCAVIALGGHPHGELAGAVHGIGTAREHPALTAWKQGRTYTFSQPDAA